MSARTYNKLYIYIRLEGMTSIWINQHKLNREGCINKKDTEVVRPLPVSRAVTRVKLTRSQSTSNPTKISIILTYTLMFKYLSFNTGEEVL